MFKVGDRVQIKYPEKSEWNDTIRGIELGHINTTEAFEVLEVGYPSFRGLGVLLKTKKPQGWWVGPGCLVLATKPKRNLPAWW